MTTPTTVVSITVNSTALQVLLGRPETFTAIANFSNGTNQVVTDGVWGSEQPTVASVESGTGRVTGLISGEATIFVTTQGLRGSKRINVRPNYANVWSGTYAVTSCSETGGVATLAFCTSNFTIGRELPHVLILSQLNATVSGQTALGSLLSNPFTVPMAIDGSVTINATYLSGALTVAQVWHLNITERSIAMGTVNGFESSEPSAV